MKQLITTKIAAQFPENINKPIDEFFNKEIAPEIITFLKKNKKLIIERLTEGLINYAVEKLNNEAKGLVVKMFNQFIKDEDDDDCGFE